MMSKVSPAVLTLIFQLLEFVSPQVIKIIDEAIDRVVVACENSENKWDDVLAAALKYIRKE